MANESGWRKRRAAPVRLLRRSEIESAWRKGPDEIYRRLTPYQIPGHQFAWWSEAEATDVFGPPVNSIGSPKPPYLRRFLRRQLRRLIGRPTYAPAPRLVQLWPA